MYNYIYLCVDGLGIEFVPIVVLPFIINGRAGGGGTSDGFNCHSSIALWNCQEFRCRRSPHALTHTDLSWREKQAAFLVSVRLGLTATRPDPARHSYRDLFSFEETGQAAIRSIRAPGYRCPRGEGFDSLARLQPLPCLPRRRLAC